MAYRTVRADDIEPTSECAVLRLCPPNKEGGCEGTNGDPSLHFTVTIGPTMSTSSNGPTSTKSAVNHAGMMLRRGWLDAHSRPL